MRLDKFDCKKFGKAALVDEYAREWDQKCSLINPMKVSNRSDATVFDALQTSDPTLVFCHLPKPPRGIHLLYAFVALARGTLSP